MFAQSSFQWLIILVLFFFSVVFCSFSLIDLVAHCLIHLGHPEIVFMPSTFLQLCMLWMLKVDPGFFMLINLNKDQHGMALCPFLHRNLFSSEIRKILWHFFLTWKSFRKKKMNKFLVRWIMSWRYFTVVLPEVWKCLRSLCKYLYSVDNLFIPELCWSIAAIFIFWGFCRTQTNKSSSWWAMFTDAWTDSTWIIERRNVT